MAQNARTRSLRLVHPQKFPDFLGPVSVDVTSKPLGPDGEPIGTDGKPNGPSKTEHADGSVTIDFNPQKSAPDLKQGGHFENLALKIDEGELGRIASELIELIRQDDESRKEWLETRARGIRLLGLKIEEPKGEILATGTLEGMSTIRHPILLDSVLRFQANARGELLPAAGPVKIRNDMPIAPNTPSAPPPPPPQAPPGAPPGMMPGMMPGMGMGMPGMMPGMMGGMMPGMQAPPGAPPRRTAGGYVPTTAVSYGPAISSGSQAIPPNLTPVGSPGQMSGQIMIPRQAGGFVPPSGPPAQPPMPPMMGHNGGPPMMTSPFAIGTNEDLATALETDMNHYLTAVATEYYPDTDRMLFWVGAGGQGIKKVYNCPLKRRPVSESIDAEDLIVSNAATNLEGCGRITHRIKMRPSLLKRMQIIGAYRDVHLSATYYTEQNAVDLAKKEIEGIKPMATTRPEELDQEIYECYCELDIAGYEHKSRGKITGLRVPYKVTIHKESRQVLELRRNWEEGDKLCMAKEYFVDFAFVRALGFYGIGLMHIVGNTSMTLTAAWREMLDAGMFASFPGFLFNKALGRQLGNQMRIPPGAGLGVEVGTGRIQDHIMGVPYKEPGPAFTAFIAHVEEVGQKVAGSAEIQIGEGNQEVPVGTTMAIIEQATKVMDAVHKRLHAAQAKEFQLLKARFKEDPEAFWRHNKKPAIQWRKDQFLQALDNNDLVPVADPNNPTSLHRIMKATAVKTLQMQNPALYNAMEVDKRIMRIVGIDPEGLFNTTPTPPPPDPKMMAVQQKAQAQQQANQIQAAELQLKAQTAQQDAQMQAAEMASRQRLEQSKIEQENVRLQREQVIHAHDMAMDHAERTNEMRSDHMSNQMDMAAQAASAHQDMMTDRLKAMQELQSNQQQHAQDIAHTQQMHAQKLDHARQLNEAKVEAARAMARAKPKSNGNGS